MSTTIIDSPAVPLWKQKHEESQRRSAAARKAAETRERRRREEREYERSQENKLAWTYESTLTLEQRQELELSLMQAEAHYNRKAKQFADDQRQMIASVLKTAAIKYGWNQVKAATTLGGSSGAPESVYNEEQHIDLAEVLDSFLHDDENHPEFKDVDEVFDRDVPELRRDERTDTFPEGLECEDCGKAIRGNDDRVPGHSATGVLCPACADATGGAEGKTVTND
jgi:hypothetical protein